MVVARSLPGYRSAMSATRPPNFADLLTGAIAASGSAACVGLDPVLEKLPAEVRARHTEPLAAIREFCTGVLEAVRPHIGVVKPQSACFERYGGRGVMLLEEICRDARARGFVVVLDAKRGDIGISAEHYAAACVHAGVHAVTLSGYLGPSTIEPFLKAGLGAFVLVRTSNPDSDAVQGNRLADGRTVAEMMADHVAALGEKHVGACGMSALGAVVGATKSADARALRERMPRQVFLVPGYGAQGGTAEDIRAMRTKDGGGALVTASRSVIYPQASGNVAWTASVGNAATQLRAELSAI